MIYLRYLRILLRHKWYVFLECVKLGMPVTGLIHDWSKFLPDEFIPYARYFSIPRRTDKGAYTADEADDPNFLLAWLKHQRRNPHHWQWWLLVQDEDDSVILPMSDHSRREMLADWRGANKTYGGDGLEPWYVRNKETVKIHPDTREWVEEQILTK